MTRAPRKNWLEWAVFAVGLVLLVATVGYLALQTAKPRRGGVSIQVSFGPPESGGTRYLVPVELSNRGAEPAEAVTVEVALEARENDDLPERARLTVGYLPGHSRREARLEFRENPRGRKLVVRSLSYAVP